MKEHSSSTERGQVLVIGLIVCVALTMVAISVANVGMMVAEKIHVQDSVDAAAYSAAVVEARYMNLAAYLNRAMIANYNSMAFDTAFWAVIDADDHGIAVVTDLLYKISAVLFVFPITTAFAQPVDQVADVLRDYVHHPLHTLNHELNELFAQDDDAKDLNQYIEIFNIDVLTVYQGLLYAALQASRFTVAQEVAKKMDPDIITTTNLGLAAETVSYDEMMQAVDYVIKDPDARDQPFKAFNQAFDKMAGTADKPDDHPLLFSATTEASLDKFVAGRTRDGDPDMLRQFNLGNIIPATGAIEFALNVYCYSECVAECTLTLGISCDCDCDAQVDMTLGAAIRDGQEDKADDKHVPFIARRRMREVNFFGLDLEISGVPGADALSSFLGNQGHTSGDVKNDVANFANASPSINHGLDSTRSNECIKSGTGCIPYSRGLNSMNASASSSMLMLGVVMPPLVDDHWDGTFDDIEPVNSWEIFDPVAGKVTSGEYLAESAAEGLEDGVPKYDWQLDIDNVGFPEFHYPQTGAEKRPTGTSGGDKNNFLQGPSVAVVGVKAANKIHGLRGLGIGNEYSITAMSRAQVYYLRNPNRPDEQPSTFNPHWVARLAPMNSDDTPILLRQGLPYVASIGLPMEPTH